MCGIAGIVDCGAGFGPERLKSIAIAMRDTMVHRGPDDAGIWVDDSGKCALAHRRLSILDLRPEGRQPMGTARSPVQITFNGEIYNFQELRRSLESDGCRFKTRTDTEVLAHLFEDLDPCHLPGLEGMYAFGIWDPKQKKLLLARDAFGKKPLYYAQGAGWFAFASELRALRCIPGFDPEISREALAEYLLLQYVHAPRTIYAAARKLQPGCYLEVDFSSEQPRSPRIGRHFSFDAGACQPRPCVKRAAEVDQLRGLVVDAVRKRMVSDVPLGAFLSGGVDSTIVAAVMVRELGCKVKTFAIGFEGAESEHLYARQVAEYLNTEHYEEILKPDAMEMIGQIAEILDEPNGDSSCLPTYLLSRFTRKHVTVALSGDGGDEMFGGYGRYRDVLNEEIQSIAGTRQNWNPADAYLSDRWLIFSPERAAGLLGTLPAPVRDMLHSWRYDLNNTDRPLLHRMRNIDVQSYMPGAVLAKVDRMSMRHALEVRCPLLDTQVAQFAQGLSLPSCWEPPAETKRILKILASRYVPAEWIRRPKMGFGLPANAWSREKIMAFARDILSGSASRLRNVLDANVLDQVLKEQEQPNMFSIYRMWPMLILELWLRSNT